MNRKEWRQIYRKVAQMNHVTPREVKREIRATIKEMYTTPQTDEVLTVQAQIPRRGKLPTPEEVIMYIANQIRDDHQDTPESGIGGVDTAKFYDIKHSDQGDGV